MDREALEAVLGFRVLSWPGPYVTAFTHKTGCKYVNGESFEKLEFLGDAVLGFIVGRYLFDMYPDQNEGFLSQMRTKLVSGKALAAIADRMGLSALVIMSPKALRAGYNSNPKILEDVLESLIGAIFLDAGMVAARTFVLGMFRKYVDPAELMKNTNYKDVLMQLCQTRTNPLPTYHSMPTEGPHPAGFRVTAHACGKWGVGTGKTKRDAEQQAAKAALLHLGARVDS